MDAAGVVQSLSLGLALGVIAVWAIVGRRNPRVGNYALVPIALAALTMAFYIVVLFIDYENTELFKLLSALLRAFELSIFMIGGGMMLRAIGRRHE